MALSRNRFRLPAGGRINRNKPVTFRFNGKTMQGYAGDTLASALLANGVRLVGRSFKYHRPRGVMSAGIEETNAVVQLTGQEDEPGLVATAVPIYEGLEAVSVTGWPGVRWDLGAINDWLHRLFPAGFYYKTFMWPTNWWNVYGYFIRRMAGLGKAPETYRPEDRYEKRYHHCDVLVVGAGPAGLAAALAAGNSGARVMLVDEQVEAGGSLLGAEKEIDGEPALDWVAETVRRLREMPEVIHLQRTTAAGYYDHNMVYALEHEPEESWLRERLWRIRAKQVIIAAGAIERPLVFPDNDRPGIMLASAAAAYVCRYGVRPGTSVVYITNNNSAYDSAFILARHHIHIAAVLDTRRQISNGLREQAEELGITVLTHYGIKSVKGKKSVSGLVAAPLDDLARDEYYSCDLICVSGGWNPTLHLQSQSGAKPVYSERIAGFIPGESVQAEITTGAANGNFNTSECFTDGIEAGCRAARLCGYEQVPQQQPIAGPEINYSIEALWELPSDDRNKRAFLDYQDDVTSADVKLALRENYASVELVKRYTTAGMGIDQGKVSNVNTIGVISGLTGTAPGAVGTTTSRPPYSPISFGAWAGIDQGDIIFPARRTPITQWFEKHQANFDEAGALWRRPFQIPEDKETPAQAVNREALAVRNGVGIYDGTPLGKIEITGPDAMTFLNRVYTNDWAGLPIGMGRFGFMLYEDGRMFDDGVTFRLGENHYLMTTGSGVATAVHTHLERLLQCEWRDLRVYLTRVTEQWANICVCGPRAREVIAKTGTDIELGNQAFPFMAIRTDRVAGFDARVARVSYTGELSFEINVRARDGLAVWEALMVAGKEFDITPVGSETSLLLRLEKGFIAAWAEGDGYANLHDAGMAWIIGKNKDDFIGKRTMEYIRNLGGDRPQIIGLIPADPEFVPPDGAPIIEPDESDEANKMIGHVTAGGYSPNLGHSIALAQLKNGRDRIGDSVAISTVKRIVEATVSDPVFIDPGGERMRS